MGILAVGCVGSVWRRYRCFWRCSPAAGGTWWVAASPWEWCLWAGAGGTADYSQPPVKADHHLHHTILQQPRNTVCQWSMSTSLEHAPVMSTTCPSFSWFHIHYHLWPFWWPFTKDWDAFNETYTWLQHQNKTNALGRYASYRSLFATCSE